MESIVSDNTWCFVCGHPFNTENHHIFFGKGKRDNSEKFGLKVRLCPNCHRGTKGVHGRDGHDLDVALKKIAQIEFEKKYSREEFIRIFGKNYL